MIILIVIEILLGLACVSAQRPILEAADPRDRRRRPFSLEAVQFFFHGKAGFHHISQMNRVCPAFLSLFLPYRKLIAS